MLVYALVSILGLNPGAVPRMGLHPDAPAPFGSCLFFYAIYLCGFPSKAVKKRKKKERTLNKGKTNSSLV